MPTMLPSKGQIGAIGGGFFGIILLVVFLSGVSNKNNQIVGQENQQSRPSFSQNVQNNLGQKKDIGSEDDSGLEQSERFIENTENQDQLETDQPLVQAVESITQEPQNEASQTELQQTSSSEDSKTEGQSAQKLYKIIKVVDGDTVTVDMDGIKETLRLIGINTPETVDPRKPVECFGREASNKAKEVLIGKSVILESDPTQGERDKYGRLLRYVFLEDGTDFNKLMISEGYAYEYTYSAPYKYQIEFKQAQQEAEQNKRGLWADNACVADNSANQAQASPTTQTTPIPTPTTTTTVCNCSGNTYNCPDFTTQKQAQACYNYCIAQGRGDVHKLDRDKDGVVCETLP